MCGRFFMSFDDSDQSAAIQKKLYDKDLFEFAQGEIFPSQNVVVLTADKGKLDVDVMKWGFNTKYKSINARSEGIENKWTFKPYLNNRCIVLANGFYEWVKEGSRKHKIYIQKEDEPWIYMAGIYNDKREFVIVTGESEDKMKFIHDRTPILIQHDDVRNFLNNRLNFNVDNKKLIFNQVN